ncbi:MAG: hypothetical protein M1820_000292 [Bogoriella megaspora]|nr:MAG: hypothetical protein M1820_000292 [Bogoriella megaspora]
MFRVPNPSDIDLILNKYTTLKQDAQKDGKPYILAVTAGRAVDDPRNQGYNFVAQTKFASLEDMRRYYDEDCEAHKALKATTKGKVELPPLTVYMDEVVQG